MRVCKECGEEKDDSLFITTTSNTGKKYLRYLCKDCNNIRQRERYKETDWWSRHLKSKYGLTIEQYEELLSKSNHQCQMCEATENLCVDHDHETNEVRGILCKTCNTGIGFLKHNKEILNKGIEYLESSVRHRK